MFSFPFSFFRSAGKLMLQTESELSRQWLQFSTKSQPPASLCDLAAGDSEQKDVAHSLVQPSTSMLHATSRALERFAEIPVRTALSPGMEGIASIVEQYQNAMMQSWRETMVWQLGALHDVREASEMFLQQLMEPGRPVESGNKSPVRYVWDPGDMPSRKIAIACQGGGSHTAFTAGVLSTWLRNGVQKKHRIVSLSGTSGGAICAALAWYSLIKASQGDRTPIEQRLGDFWLDNAAQNVLEQCFNDFAIQWSKLMDRGVLPQWSNSPGSYFSQLMLTAITAYLPRERFHDLRKLIESHLDFTEIESWKRPRTPLLVIGAADVLSGKFQKFNSFDDGVKVEYLLASAAIPTLFPAVEVGKAAYWDGLFSDNPPTDDLLDPDFVGQDNLPDELWIIQINPKRCQRVPVAPEEIVYRRNEMIGNESLYQDVAMIEKINKFIDKGAFTPEFRKEYRRVNVRYVEMSPELQQSLEYSTKLDRSLENLGRLFQDGQRQGEAFLANLPVAKREESVEKPAYMDGEDRVPASSAVQTNGR